MTYVPTTKAPLPGDRGAELMWLEEQYWGHRLWDQQTPWLVFLEFMCVAESALRAGQLLSSEKSLYPSVYSARGRIYLRNILFHNEQLLLRTAHTVSDSATAWRQWLGYMEENARGLDAGERDFSYLRSRFDSFQEFAMLVRALRSCVVESDTNKRWSSRFLFPFGPAAIYEDLDIKAVIRRDYINFGRTGELLYLMLSRSRHREELAQLLPGRLLDGQNKWNKLVSRLQPDAQEQLEKRGKDAFLPYDQCPVFDLIAEDWIALLRLRLPGFDVIPYLVTSGAFGIFLYQLHTSAHLLGHDVLPSIICEVVAPKKSLVRELSVQSLDDNVAMSVDAIETLIAKAEAQPQWLQAGPPMEMLNRRREVLQMLYGWSDEGTVTDPAELLKEFRRAAKERHRQHFGQVHRTFGRGIGLVSRRGTNRLRYAPTDGFLKGLIYANVKRRTEFGELLAHLYRRYGLVFGEREAESAKTDREIDKKPFQANASRLEHRLGSLGLVKRLSDACAYVENPYSGLC